MARIRFDEKYVSDELEKVGNALTIPVSLYIIGGTAMIRYGLKAATKDIDVLLSTYEETMKLIEALKKSGYHQIQTSGLAPQYQMMLTTQILENAEGFRWDVFQEFVCKKLRLSSGMIERSKTLFKTGQLTVRLVSKEDIFLLKTITERDDDEADLLILARSKLDWELVLKECMNQSRDNLKCEIDLYDRLDKLRTSHGLETPIYSRISKVAQNQMEKWFEDKIIRELITNPKTLEELLERLKCGKDTLLPSLARLEKVGRIKRIKDKYILNK